MLKLLRRLFLPGTKAAALSALLLSGAGFGGTWHRYFELTAHFKVQYLAVALCCLVALAAARAWRWCVSALLGCLLNAAVILPYYLPPGAARQAAPAAPQLRLLLANVNAANRNYQALIDLTRATQPDVLILQEATEAWVRAMQPLAPLLPHAHVVGRRDSFGIALYSRLPLTAARTIYFGRLRVPGIGAQLAAGPSGVSLVTAHPPPPRAELFADRNEQLAELAALVRQTPTPAVLIGDLNTTGWSPYYRRLVELTGLHDARIGFGLRPTWPAHMRLLFIPIDQCLVSPDVQVLDVGTGPDIGSDHLPLLVTLALPDAPAMAQGR